MSEEQSSGRAAARQCVRAPRSGGGWGVGGDVTGIPRAEGGHYGQFSVSDDEIFKKAWRAPPVTRYCWRGFNTFNQKNNHALIVTALKRELIKKYRDCCFSPEACIFTSPQTRHVV